MQAAAKDKTNRRLLSVLIADDDPDVLATLSALLAQEGYVVNTCSTGKEALHCIERYKPDVCVVDIVMPGISGFEIAREVQNLRLPRRPVMIGLSGWYTKTSDMLLARAAGFDHYITKGADPMEIVRLLGTIARNRPDAT